MSRFFGRRASVTMAREPPLLPVTVGGGIRIQFKIEKQPLSPPNTADISITNLSAATRGGLQKFGAEFELRAGYADDAKHLPLVFKGQARTIDNVRKDAEWLTRIQGGDGLSAFRFADVVLSRGPGTSAEDVARALAERISQNGVDVSAFMAQLSGRKINFPVPQFVFGYAAQGNALQELEKLLGGGLFYVSIQSGELRVIPSNGTSPKEAIILSPSSGLLGSPEHGSPDKNGLPSVLKVRSLLVPRIEPGDAFILEGVDVKGTYRAEKVVHAGDTHTGDFTTEIESRSVAR